MNLLSACSTFGNQVGFPTLSQGVQYLPLAWTTEKPYPPGDFAGLSQSTWAHEIGHGLGIPMHSQAYKCFVNGPLSVNRDDCVNTRHQHDLMGLRHAATHFNGHFKDHFGWMPEANKTTIHSDGCHVIDLHDLAQPADPGQTQFVEIPLPYDVPAGTAGGSEIDFDVVTLEFRGHTGFDRRSFKLVPLADGGFRDVTAEVNAFGALVQALNCDEKQEPWHPCVTYEIDMQPNTMTDTNLPDFWDPIDGYLLEGETWEVPGNPMKITVLDTGDAPESIEVLVEFGTAGPTWYGDTDGDGFGDPVAARTACLQPAGYVANDTDCDDGDADTYPGAPEINDGRDNQCPGDEGYGAADEISGDVGFKNPDDKNTYSWIAQPGATLYEVARLTAPDHSLDCTTVQTAETFWEDLEEPLPGSVFYYLTQPVEPHAGSWGQDSTSSERTNVCP